MMADHNFGKNRKTNPMQLVNLNVAASLSLQNLTTPITPKNVAKSPSNRPPPSVTPMRSAVTPMRLVESMSQAAPPPPPLVPPPLVPPPPPSPPVIIVQDEDEDDADAYPIDDHWFVNDGTVTDGFGFLPEEFPIEDFAKDHQDAGQESSILDATTTTPTVPGDSELDTANTSASTIRLNSFRSKTTLSTVVSNAEGETDGDVVPHNGEADLGAPGNLIGVKRAKRIRALERETEIIKTSVQKMQRNHDTILSQCLAAAKSEAREQLSDLHSHWCQLMGFDVSDMNPTAIESTLQRFDNFRRHARHQDQHEPESQIGVCVDEENWMQHDLFGGALFSL